MSSTQADTTTKLSYLLPTGTFLTFQVLAPLSTNNGQCGPTEKILTTVTLGLLVLGCIFSSFTDSYTAPDGKVYYGFLTCKGLWVPGYGSAELHEADHNDEPAAATRSRVSGPASDTQDNDNGAIRIQGDYIKGPIFKPMLTDYFSAGLSAIAFLTLTMFTDPVSSCFYPHLSESLLKTLPVLLATVFSFCCSFITRIRHGYGNCTESRVVSRGPAGPMGTPLLSPGSREHSFRGEINGEQDAIRHRGDDVA